MSSDFERQVAEGNAIPLSGWDFSPIEERWRRGNPPWNYAEILREKTRTAASMVDLGTGDGEFLASLAPLPRRSFATEGYRPNLAIAQRRLAPLGVRVLPIGPDLHIDLPDATIGLVADRHEDFSGSEMRRILTPGGWFITQQVGGRNNVELSQKFAARPPRPTNQISSSVELAEEIAGAGLAIHDTKEATYADEFLDIGALVFYLRMIPWEVPGFSVDRHRLPLWEIYEEIERVGSFRVTTHRLLVVAQRPG